MALRLTFLLFFISTICLGQELKLLFVGDVMGHDSQIISAYDSVNDTFDYDEVFASIKPLMSSADFTIANLEVTLAGQPYGGYPKFSSPDELAISLKKAGVDALVLANNHSADRGNEGIIRTIDVIDSLNIHQTGTFKDNQDRSNRNLLRLEKNGISIGILNYTYGLNGMPVEAPVNVNLLDTVRISNDLKEALKQELDKLIVFVHWGKEYQHEPSSKQRALADFFFEHGVDIIIGSHPHVLQPMEYFNDKKGERFVAYSMGNFVSNQRTFPRDGGAMVEITLKKENGITTISDKGYHLTWVNKTFPVKKGKFEILSTAEMEKREFKGLSEFSRDKLRMFMDSSRMLMQEKNVDVGEIIR